MNPPPAQHDPGVPLFRRGCTSYVIPDDILPNVRYMAPFVDDIEIVLFESEEIGNLPDSSVIAELARLSAIHNLSYTVHLPTDIAGIADSPSAHRRFVSQAQRIVELFAETDPWAYIVHLEGHEQFLPGNHTDHFHRKSLDLIQDLIRTTGIPPSSFAVENLCYPWTCNPPLALETGCSLCTDIGHLMMTGSDLDTALETMLPLTRVIHLHGIHNGKDHSSLAWMKENHAFMSSLKTHLSRYTGVLTLEVFEESDTFTSLATLAELFP